MYGRNITSDLINSYAWDTATIFIESCGTNKYYAAKIGSSLSGEPENTGTSKLGSNAGKEDVQCNIYDMASNVFEWETEIETDGSELYIDCTIRGGNCDYDSIPMCTRKTGGKNTDEFYDYGFRPILYF